nr:glycosyltransferase family 4 protein [Polymorphobacter sp.]
MPASELGDIRDELWHGDAAGPVTIAFPFVGGAVGGSHISAVKLITGLDPREFKPLVILHRAEAPTIDLLESEGISFERAPTEDCFDPVGPDKLRQLAAVPRRTFLLERFLRQRNVRIVHTNDGPMHATWALPARLAGAKLLWHHRGNPRAAGLRFLAPWLANRVVSVSRFASPPPGLISAANRNSVVHSPFDTSIADAASMDARPATALAPLVEMAQLGLPPGARLLGFFGHLIDRKRPIQFVETVAAITARCPGMPVAGLMFGEALEPGLDVAVMERARELGVADRIRLMGFRTPPEPWLEACDVLVVTAVDEPYGRTLVEAMLLGTPVVAAASGGNVEAIRHGETGVLVPPDRPEAFANAIIALLEEPMAAAALAATARTEALARYGIAGHVRSISDIYRQLAA